MRHPLLGPAAAALLVLSYPPHDFGFLAWIALAPLLLAIEGRSPGSAGLLSFLTGTLFFLGVGRWMLSVPGISFAGYGILALYLGAYVGLFGALLNHLEPRVPVPRSILAPLAWVSIEFLRTHAGFLAAPGALLSHTQHLNIPVIQVSRITGAYGVTFLVVMVNTAIAEAARSVADRERRRDASWKIGAGRSLGVALLLLAASLGYGWSVLSRPPGGESHAVTVVQGNHPLGFKWIPENRKVVLDAYVRMTREASRSDPAPLVVWPEITIPSSLTHDAYSRWVISRLAREVNASLLVGGAHGQKFRGTASRNPVSYNTAYLFSPEGALARQYNKIHLVPFGEYIPLKDRLPWPSRFLSDGAYFIPGTEHTVFHGGPSEFGVVICWESMFPDLFRTFVKRGARFMVNMTNEGWFRDPAAIYQFAAICAFRAVENGVSVVRCANTGVSCFINPRGEVERTLSRDGKEVLVEGFLTHRVALKEGSTFYSEHGDVFAAACSGTTLLLAAWAVSGRLRRARGGTDSRS